MMKRRANVGVNDRHDAYIAWSANKESNPHQQPREGKQRQQQRGSMSDIPRLRVRWGVAAHLLHSGCLLHSTLRLK